MRVSTGSAAGRVGHTRGKRRVLIVVENLPVPFDRRVWSEATTLRAAGYEVSVICPKGHGASESYVEIDGIHVYRHPLPLEARGALAYPLEYLSALFFEFVLTWRVLLARGFDVIHACNPPDTIFLIAGFFRLFGKRFVFDHHDINPELYEAKFGRRDFFYKTLLWLERMTFRTADISIATNLSYRRIALTRGGMRPENVYVVRSGPNLERLRTVPPRPELRKGRAYLVGYVGVIGQQEGIDLLLQAVDDMVHTRGRCDTQFVIVGGGPELANLRQLAERMGIGDYVTFTGRISDQELLEVLCTADVCVNPDRVNDMNDKSTMNKIMEYMALGKPIVQFDMTEGRFSAQDASLYALANDPADLADKIAELLEDPERRRAMGEYGRRRVREELSWEHEAPKLLAAYDAVFQLAHAGWARIYARGKAR
jgi:glycosyltransferase involved in cell wall biosynthesis